MIFLAVILPRFNYINELRHSGFHRGVLEYVSLLRGYVVRVDDL